MKTRLVMMKDLKIGDKIVYQDQVIGKVKQIQVQVELNTESIETYNPSEEVEVQVD